MESKVIIVTGANTGIGFGVTKRLVEEGHQVIMACRNLERGQAAIERIEVEVPYRKHKPVLYELDLADLSSVRKFVSKFKENFQRLSILVNNAGLSLGENKRCVTKDGFEIVIGTNHLGHFLLTNLLLDLLKETAAKEGEARIIVVASQVHCMYENGSAGLKPLDFDDLGLEKPGAYKDFQAYKDSKAMNVLFTLHLARLLEGTGVTVNCVCPGLVPDSDFMRNVRGCTGCVFLSCIIPILKCCGKTRTVPIAAVNIRNLCCAPEMHGISGFWYVDGEKRETSTETKLVSNQEFLWTWSLKQCGL